MNTAAEIFLVVFSLCIGVQGVFSICLMLYTWANPRRIDEIASPETYLPPLASFSLILPARHERDVIAATLRKISEIDYPADLLEILVVCHHADTATISAAQRAIDRIAGFPAQVVTFEKGPINKPHGLNVGLRAASHDVVAVFDAEDDPHPDILKIVDTLMQQKGAAIIQAGVQLMDLGSSWYAVHNVLEYFFWFRSRLHFHAKTGAVPLGGNTVFIRRSLLQTLDGWDERCLTEDADLGVRAGVQGFPITVTYDPRHVTREETPGSVASFVRQRTRWNQGFLQVLRKGDWRRLPGWRQRVLMGFTLSFPILQAGMSLLWIPLVLFVRHMPLPIAMLSYLPLYLLVFQLLLSMVGLAEFGDAYGLKVRRWDTVRLVLGFVPYLVLLSFAALRAAYRQVAGFRNWEKTAHQGSHRHNTEESQLATGDLEEFVNRSEEQRNLPTEVAHETP